MHRSRESRFALRCSIVVVLLGCTAAPEKTCEKIVSLRRADAQTRGKSFTPEREAQVRDKCLADMREMDAMYEVLVEHFGDWTPAGTLVCINNLSAPGARIELDVIAAVPA